MDVPQMVLLHCLTFMFLFAERDLRQLSQDKRFAYITYQDLHTIREYKDKTVFAIKAPPGTQLEVPQELKKKVCQSDPQLLVLQGGKIQ